MEHAEQIRTGLKKLAEQVGPLNSLLATVVSVNEAERTCVLLDDDVEIYDVRLRPVINGNESITIFPKIGTWALAIRIEEDSEWQVISVDEADKYRIKIDNTEFEMSEGFLVKRGNDTLKQVLTLIIEACQKILVIQGNNPDFIKLAQALSKVNNIFK